MVSDNNSPPMWNGLSGGPGQKFAARAESWAGGLAILAHRGVGAIGSVFQSIDWLEIWNESIGRVSGLPFMIGVWEVRTGTLAALPPLLPRRSSCLRVIERADCGVSDYNCPILGASAPRDLDGARAMWRTILDALPAADIVKFTKMPGALGLCAVHSNSLAVSSTWEDYLQSLERRFRKELRRSWRVFTKENGATFRGIDSLDDARRVFAALESQQRARFGKDETYLLDRPEIASFYRAMTIKRRRRRECDADRTHVWRRGRRHPARVGGQIQIRNGSDLHSSHQMALLLAWSPRHCRDNPHAA